MSSVTAVAPAGTAPSSSDQPTTSMDGPNTQLDRDAFLKLLVAQLKYQDPTKPADTSQMVAQSAQLTMVDRLNEIASQMTASGTSQKLSLASSIVGKEITFLDVDGTTHTAVVQSARLDNDELVLTAGAFTVPMAAVNSIASPPPVPLASPVAGTDGGTADPA